MIEAIKEALAELKKLEAYADRLATGDRAPTGDDYRAILYYAENARMILAGATTPRAPRT